jgi:LPXTG-motif cell wall-anchored protein
MRNAGSALKVAPVAMLLLVMVTVGAAPSPVGAATAPTFTTPVELEGAAGGEPSIATDRLGNVYVAGPQGIPAGANGESGAAVWISHDNADTFTKADLHGTFLGGGDSDIAVAPDDGTVWLTDLEAAAADVCISKDKGATFTSIGPVPDPLNCSQVNVGQAGASNDRQWLTVDKGGRTYLSYHEFVTAQPLSYRTDNGGQDLFTNVCGPVVTDPAIEVNIPQDITGGTLVSKPVVDSAGNLYVMFTTTTQAQNAAAIAAGHPSGTFSQIYLAKSTDHCATFTNVTVFDGSAMGTNTVQFGDDFNVLAVDGGDNLYAIAAGFVGTTPFAPLAHLYLLSSTDGGAHWSAPLQIDADGGAHMLPGGVAGPGGGQLAIGYFHTTNGITDPNDITGEWTYTVTESTNANAAAPSFVTADVQPGHLFHKGDICNQGILCIQGDRSLLDFTAATVDGNGCPIFTFAGHPDVTAGDVVNYVSRQTSGCFAVPAVPIVATTTAPAPSAAPTSAPRTGGGTLPKTGMDTRLLLLVVAALVGLALVGRRVRRAA